MKNKENIGGGGDNHTALQINGLLRQAKLGEGGSHVDG
jgi:hypothetical protein